MYVWLCVWSSNDLWTAGRQIEFAFFVTLLQILLPQFVGYLKYLTVNYLFFVNGPKTGLFKFLWTFVAFTVRGQDCLRNDAIFLSEKEQKCIASSPKYLYERNWYFRNHHSQPNTLRTSSHQPCLQGTFSMRITGKQSFTKTTNLKTIFLIIINQCLTNWKYSILEKAETD